MPTNDKAFPKSLKPQLREFAFERAAINADARTADVTFSTEYGVERWYGTEILAHDGSAVRMKRMNDGAPVLLNHRMDQQIGVVENARVEGGKGKATIRFGKSQLATEIFQDVTDGIRQKMSVGYFIHRVQEDKKKNEFRVIDWEPFEVSVVAVPADPNASIGRSAEFEQEVPVEVITAEAATGTDEPTRGNRAMAETTATTPEQNVAVIREQAASAARVETERINSLRTLATNHNMTDKLTGWIAEGRTVETAQAEILDAVKRTHKPVNTPDARETNIQLTDKESREYSIVRAMRAQYDDSVEAGFERELSQEISKKMKRDTAGIFVPMSLRGSDTRVLNKNANAAGGYTVATELQSLVELLRNQMKVREMGATVMSDLNGDIAFPKQTGAGTLSWVAENPGADTADSDMTFGQFSLTPKAAQSTTAYTKKLLAQSSVDIENLVRNDLAAVNALGIDLAAISGTGAGNQPTGILNQAGITILALGANGAIPTFGDFVNMETELYKANVPITKAGYLTTPGIRGKMKNTAVLANTAALPVWTGSEVNGYNAQVSNQVPSTLTKGTSVGVAHAVIFANWPDLLIAEWGVMEIIVDPYAKKKQALVEVTSFVMVDIGVRYPVSFVAIKDALIA
jgi:HK97 family phage major capsid protein/HK97 family phage prohead protease